MTPAPSVSHWATGCGEKSLKPQGQVSEEVATPLPQLDLWRGNYVLLTTSADSYYIFKKYTL